MGKGSCCVCHQKIVKGCKYSLHRFPKNAERSSLWLKACKFPLHRNNVLLTMHVCSRHFTDDSFRLTRPGGPKFLKQDAVPSIFDVRRELKRLVPELLVKKENVDPNPDLLEKARFIDCSVPDVEILERKESVVSTPNIKKNTATLSCSVPDVEILERKGSVVSTPNIKNNTATLSWSVPVAEMYVPRDVNDDANTSQDEQLSGESNAVWRPHRIGSLQPEHFSTPSRAGRHLNMVKDAITQKAKRIKLLQQKTRRLTKQVTRLSSVIQQLKKKKLISKEHRRGNVYTKSARIDISSKKKLVGGNQLNKLFRNE